MDTSEWQGRTGDVWAAQWKRTDRSFTFLTEKLLASLRGRVPRHVLDIGCGAGELTLAIARGHPGASVVGLDISGQLLMKARQRGENLPNAAFAFGDAANWSPPMDFAPDTLISRHGVMFFDDPTAAFGHLAAICAPGADLAFSCFRSIGANPFFTEVLRLLPVPPPAGDPHAPGPFAFADRDRVQAILANSGWRDINFAEVDFPMIAGVGEDAIEDSVEYYRKIGPAARASSELPEADLARFLDKLRELAARNCRDNVVSLTAGAWIVTASKA